MIKKCECRILVWDVVIFKNVSENDYRNINKPLDKFWSYNPEKKQLIIEK